MTPAEILREARALIDAPEKWTQGEWARDSHGDASSPDDSDCECFCIEGAIWRVARGRNNLPAMKTARLFWVANGLSCRTDIPKFNDAAERTHAEVMAAFDRAIALAEKEQG